MLPVLPPSPTPLPGRFNLIDLFKIANWQDDLVWTPFKPGVLIHRLYGDGISGPSAALLRFERAGQIPLHEHTGYEHIIVLTGSQRDQHGTACPGTLSVNPPGSQHRIFSEAGCIVLAIYEKPVRFLEDSSSD